jgi:hypothetical protein
MGSNVATRCSFWVNRRRDATRFRHVTRFWVNRRRDLSRCNSLLGELPT